MTGQNKLIILFTLLGILILVSASWFFYALFLSLSVNQEGGGIRGPEGLVSEKKELLPFFSGEIKTLIPDLENPLDFAYIEEKILIGDELGQIWLYDLNSEEIKTIGQLPDFELNSSNLALTVGRNFDQELFLFAFYSSGEDFNHLIRFDYQESLEGEGKVILNQIPKMVKPRVIKIDPQGFLWLATDGSENPSQAQDPESLIGKIIRLGFDGQVPADNPIPGLATYSLGYNQPLGLWWPQESQPVVLDRGGPAKIASISPGGNFGWPMIDDCQNEIEPAIWCEEGADISGVELLFENEEDLIMIWTTSQGQLKKAHLKNGQMGDSEIVIDGGYGSLGKIIQGEEGIIYVLTLNGQLLEVKL